MIPSVDMIQQYVPDVAPQTIAAIIRVESGGNQYAIGINGSFRRRLCLKSTKESVAEARYLISKGYSVDLGLMQINSRNLPGLGITIEQAFDPAINMQAGAKILIRGYRGAIKRYGPGQDALKAALSAYNTGNYQRGFKNGYVAKYYFMPASNNAVIYTEEVINPYTAELTVYSQVVSPTIANKQDISQYQSAGANVGTANSQFE
jgi:type IV secretion system protein VirB1